MGRRGVDETEGRGNGSGGRLLAAEAEKVLGF